MPNFSIGQFNSSDETNFGFISKVTFPSSILKVSINSFPSGVEIYSNPQTTTLNYLVAREVFPILVIAPI